MTEGGPVSVLRTFVPQADNDLAGSEAISLISEYSGTEIRMLLNTESEVSLEVEI